MPFRDDRAALRAQVERLEQDLVEARQASAARPDPAPVTGRQGSLGAVLGTVVAVALPLGAAAYFALRGASALAATFASVAAVVATLGVGVVVIRMLLVVVAPNQIAVAAGRRHVDPDGTVRGYRVVRAGRVLRIPLIETVELLDLTLGAISVEVADCHLSDGRAVAAFARGEVRLASEPPGVHHVVERFLAKPREEILRLATDVCAGSLRRVLGESTLEAVERDPERCARQAEGVIRETFEGLGLELVAFIIDRVERTL